MSDIQSQLQEIVPRAAIYKGTNKRIDSTVHKVEYVTYPSNLSHVLEVGSSIYLTIASIFEGAPGEVWIWGFTHSDSPKPVSKG